MLFHLEDEGPLRDVFRTTVNMFDKNVELVQFDNSDEALPYIDEHINNIRMFLLDIRVPGAVDGMEVARRIRAAGSTRPIVITSAYTKPDSKDLKALDLIWMPKPMHLLNVAQKILPMMHED